MFEKFEKGTEVQIADLVSLISDMNDTASMAECAPYKEHDDDDEILHHIKHTLKLPPSMSAIISISQCTMHHVP